MSVKSVSKEMNNSSKTSNSASLATWVEDRKMTSGNMKWLLRGRHADVEYLRPRLLSILENAVQDVSKDDNLTLKYIEHRMSYSPKAMASSFRRMYGIDVRNECDEICARAFSYDMFIVRNGTMDGANMPIPAVPVERVELKNISWLDMVAITVAAHKIVDAVLAKIKYENTDERSDFHVSLSNRNI